MTSLAHMFEDFGQRCPQWIKVPLKLQALPWWIQICILILMLGRTLILVLIRLNSIDIGLNVRRVTWISKVFLGAAEILPSLLSRCPLSMMSLNSKQYFVVRCKGLSILKELSFQKTMDWMLIKIEIEWFVRNIWVKDTRVLGCFSITVWIPCNPG